MNGRDKLGNEIEIGDKVRVSSIRPSILRGLPILERNQIESMAQRAVEVFDVYDDGQIWVSMIWPLGTNQYGVHAIAVDSDGIELVSKRDSAPE
jgi:hypothetical protein